MEYTFTNTCTDKIILRPHELQNLREYIDRKIRNRIHSCSKQSGYIIDIDSIDWDSMTNRISRHSGNCIFTIRYTTLNLKPEPDQILTVVVNILFKEGIFAEYNGIKILIPADELVGWEFESDKFVKDDSSIQKGDWIKVKITITRYDNGQFQCIGKLFK